MDEASSKICEKSDLARKLADFRITVSPLNQGFVFEDMLSEVIACRVVKENNRRQVYHLQTNDGGYFLKLSSLVRDKDRIRHFVLPRRRWAEWRNLHHLQQARVPAARPMVKGQSQINHPKSYFMLTEQVAGDHIPVNSMADARRLGQYAAFLHRLRVYHADLNRKNFILTPAGRFYLLDAQEVYFLPWLPRRLRINNLGRMIFNLCLLDDPEPWVVEFLAGYNRGPAKKVILAEAIDAARHQRRRRYRSRSKRCIKNSSEFEVLKKRHLRGYVRRGFSWGVQELQQAAVQGTSLKGSHVIGYEGVCIKKYARKFFHQNRCLASCLKKSCGY